MNIQYKTAVLAKEKGFNEPCDWVFEYDFELRRLNYYEGDGSGFTQNSDINPEYEDYRLTAPQQTDLQKWLREKHKIHVSVEPQYNLTNETINEIEFNDTWCAILENISKEKLVATNILCLVATKNIYEEALEEGLYEALKLIKDET